MWCYLSSGEEEPSDSEVETIYGEADEAEDRAAVLRKRAGLPELSLDVLPSAIAMKLLTLAPEPLRVLIHAQEMPGKASEVPPGCS